MSIVLALGAAAFYGSADFVGAVAARRNAALSVALGAQLAGLAVLLVRAASVVLSALGVVFQVALYRYATDGVAPPQFATVDLGHAFSPKT